MYFFISLYCMLCVWWIKDKLCYVMLLNEFNNFSHPLFWADEKRLRLISIVGSDIVWDLKQRWEADVWSHCIYTIHPFTINWFFNAFIKSSRRPTSKLVDQLITNYNHYNLSKTNLCVNVTDIVIYNIFKYTYY